MREKEKLRLMKEQEKISNQSLSLKSKLSNEEFCQKAPKEVINKLSSNLSVLEKQMEEIQIKLTSL
jgi:valyl-tRNA synthetase